MTEEQKYNNRNQTLIDILNFLRQLLLIEINKRENQDTYLGREIFGYHPTDPSEEAYNGFVDRGEPVPSKVGERYFTNKQSGEKLVEEYNYITDLYTKAQTIVSNRSLSSVDKYYALSGLLNNLFNTYNNIYSGSLGTGKINNGQSHFDAIINLSDKSGKLASQIQELNSKLNYEVTKRNIKSSIKGKEVWKTPKEARLEDKIARLQRKYTKIEEKQRIILYKRELAIARKNNKISKMEGKALHSLNTGDVASYTAIINRINDIRNKPIKTLPSPVMLIKESILSKTFSIKKFLKSANSFIQTAIPIEDDNILDITKSRESLENQVHKKL